MGRVHGLHINNITVHVIIINNYYVISKSPSKMYAQNIINVL